MKKYFLLIFVLTWVSCQDVLKEEPKAISISTFYNTAAEDEAGVNAIYSGLSTAYSFVFPCSLESLSDMVQGRGSFVQDFQTLSTTNISRSDGNWGYFYLSIRNANLIIKNAPNGSNISAADIAKYVGEAKFLRALAYFHLVRLWGGVPIRTEINMVETDVPRSTAAEVWQLIISDLEYAETNLPDIPSMAGRPSKWAAKTVLADVYFYQGLNSEASAKAKEVIQSGKYSLVKIGKVDDFNSKLYGTDVVNSTEEIFYFKFTTAGLLGQSSYIILINAPIYAGGRGNYALYTDTLKNPMFSHWDNRDLRKQNWYPYNFGNGPATMLSKKFIDPNANGGGSGVDFPLYRYADLLLLYAEASSNNGPTADGLEALNQVHRRAYGKDPTTTSDIDFRLTDYNAQSFIDLVIKERGYETVTEGKRWFDLKRRGKVQEYIKTFWGINVAEKILLWPIPVSEMAYNKAITEKNQNPGY